MAKLANLGFVELFFAALPHPDARPWVTSFRLPPAEAGRYAWAGRPVTSVHAIPDDASTNNFIAVSSFLPDEIGKRRRRKVQFAAMHAVLIDDVGTGASAKVNPRKIRLKPTVAIETSPGNRQYWYRLDPPITDRALGERLVDRMIKAGLTSDGTDPGMRGVTRYGRLPVGTNNKPRASGPWRHRVAAINAGLAYTADEIGAAFGLDLTPDPAPRLGRPPKRPDVLEDLVGRVEAAGLYKAPLSGGWYDVTCPWVHTHSGGIDTGTAIAEPSAANNWAGGFRCHHGHCEGRGVRDLYRFLEEVEGHLAAQEQERLTAELTARLKPKPARRGLKRRAA